jgi:meiotic recombination protein SPO11
VKQLSRKLNIPILALVDANPFGIEIMCVYRFGSNVRNSLCRVTWSIQAHGAKWTIAYK